MEKKSLSFFILLYLWILNWGIMCQSNIPQHIRDAYLPLLDQGEAAYSNTPSDSILTLLGRWPWGPCYTVNALEDLAYIGNGPTLHILDISEPDSPEIVGEYLTNGLVIDIEIKGTLAYVLTGKLEIFDLQDPINPVKLGEVNLFGGTLRVAAEGTLAFVSVFAGLVYAVDVSDPRQPVVRGAVVAGGQIPNCLAAKDSFAYVGNPEWPNLIIIDATNPDSLEWAGEVYIDGWGESIFLEDSLMYVGVRGFSDDHFSIYNVSDPAFPVEVGRAVLPMPNNLHINIGSLTVSDGYAYLSTRLMGVFAVEVSNPSLPVIVDRIERSDGLLLDAWATAYSGGTVAVAYYSGVWLVDATQPDSLKEHTFFPTSEIAHRVALKDNQVFVASGYAGLWILDISDPSQPRQISNVNTGGWAADVVVSDSFAYVANYGLETGDTTRGLWVVDISDIQHPQTVSHHIGIAREAYYSAHHNTLARSGDLIFMSGANKAINDSILEIIDVSDPLYPASLGVFQAAYEPYYVAVQDSFAYLATPDSGLRIIDWHDPQDPSEISHILDNARGIVINDIFAYVLTHELTVVDVSDPYSPAFLSSTGITSGVYSLDGDISGNYLYWAEGSLGVVDVSNPFQPRQITTVGGPSGVAARGDIVATANRVKGVWMFRHNALTALPDEKTAENIPQQIKLYQNFPNPFNPITSIEFYIPRKEKITIEIFNILGQKVKTLLNTEITPGNHRLRFDASDLPSGLYFYRLRVSPKGQAAPLEKAPGISLTHKMVLLR